MKKILPFLALACFAFSCTTQRVNLAFKKGGLKNQASGILIQELLTKKVVYHHQADQYFMPASNAKLVTFLEANRILKDSIPAYRYYETPDTLFFWGTGDPSLLHPQMKGDVLLKKLLSSSKVLVLADSDENVRPLGDGWAWDDYTDDYSAEISLLPVYNNQVLISIKDRKTTVEPVYFEPSTQVWNKSFAQRDRNTNRFQIPSVANYAKVALPFITSSQQSAELLSALIKKTIHTIPKSFDAQSKLVYAGKIDSLFRPMLHDSDNQIAEQLLYLIAANRNWVGPTAQIINKLQKEDTLLASLKWVDGSGLSRYNLMRPKDLVATLFQLKNEISEDRLFRLLPESGKTGTIRKMKPLNPSSSFWAKSGSFGNTYNLSGYYKNAKGKMYVFSIMGNLGNRPASAIKQDVMAILNALR